MKPKGIIFRGELEVLNEKARASAPGQFVELPDGYVHYEIAGTSNSQTVVLIPGFSVPYDIWDPTFKALVNANFRVLRYDLYGRGYSDRPNMNYNYDLFDRQLLNLLGVLGISDRIDLVGLSLGGAISVVFTDRHPEFVRKLCLIDPAGLPWKQSFTARLTQAPLLGEWLMGLLGGKVLVSNLKDYFYDERSFQKLESAFQKQMQFVGFKKALLSTLRSGATTGAKEAYEQVGNRNDPVLLIWGRQDQVVPFEISNKVRDLMPNIEFYVIDDAKHIPHYERPEEVNAIIIDFLLKTN